MTKGAYIGVNGKAAKIKKGYIGLNGVARKIGKGYIGVNQVARPFWSGGELVKYGSSEDGAISPLSEAREGLAGATVGNYALFAGGYGTALFSSKYYGTADAYNGSLVRSTPAVLSAARSDLAGASVGDYVVFAGGKDKDGALGVADAYNSSLTHTTLAALSVARYYLAGASAGGYALFAGGYSVYENKYPAYYAVADAYDGSLTRTTPTALSAARENLAGATVGGYALFAGGYEYHSSSWGTSLSYSTAVDAYDGSLVHSTPAALSLGRRELAGATVSGYALFAGGRYEDASEADAYSAVVDAYNGSLVRSTPAVLSTARSDLAGASVGDYIVFAGGRDKEGGLGVVDAYDGSLTRTTPEVLSAARSYLAGATVGGYALFAGGRLPKDGLRTPPSDCVDIYTIV